jgi:superfamily II DNA or RNA helicase
MTAAAAPRGNALIEALKAWSAGSVYLLGSRRAVLEGFERLRRTPVRRFAWTGGGAVLSVYMGHPVPHRVDVALADGRLAFRCDCGDAAASSGCPDLVAALVLLKKVLDPAAFGTIRMEPEYLRALAESLVQSLDEGGGPERPVHPVDLVLDITAKRIDACPRINGERVRIPTLRLPPALRPLASYSPSRDADSRVLALYLRDHAGACPIVLADGRDEREIAWKGDVAGAVRAELDAVDGRIAVSLAAVRTGRPGPGPLIVDDCLFDAEGGTFGRIAGDPAWRLWHSLRRTLGEAVREPVGTADGEHAFAVPLDDFRQVVLSMEGSPRETWLKAALFRIGGKAVRPETGGTVSFRLSVHPSAEREDRSILQAECLLDGESFPPPDEPFRLFSRNALPRHLQGLRLYGTLLGAFFEGLSRESVREGRAAARRAIAAVAERYPAREGVRIVEHYLSRCRAEETILSFADGRWRLATLDRKAVALLLEVPYRLFGEGVFAGTAAPGEMEADRDKVLTKLPELFGRLAARGIALHFEGKPVRPASWEITVGAARADIDWFELKPEIRCDGAAVDESAWREAVRGGGLYAEDGDIRILDEPTRRAMAAIAHALRKPKRRPGSAVVRMPRLRILDLARWRRHGIAVTLSEEDERILERLAGFRGIEARPLPGGLAGTLRPYQRDGYHWLAFLYENRFGACLADDMGLGKTVQALSLLAGIRDGTIASHAPAGTPHLVVMPPGLLFNWENEILKFCPAMKVAVYRGRDRRASFDGAGVVLTSYDVARIDIDRLAEIPFDVVVFDEAQAVKNITANTTGAVRRLQARFRLALTGTPVENHVGEYRSILDLVLPGLLGEHEALRGPMRKEDPSLVEEIKRRTRPFVLRRTKERILPDLPPKNEQDVYLDLSDRQKALYRRAVEEVRATIDRAYADRTESQARVIALTAILRLRQLCLSPALVLPGAAEDSPKIAYLADRLAELRQEGHSALVFSQFTSFLDLIERDLAAGGLGYLRLDGSTPVKERKRLVESFERRDAPSLFLLSLKAGGRGINLTKATHVFHMDPWWNPAVENQASDRTHRIGQRRRVTVVRLLMRHTVEEKMMALKRRKEEVFRALLEEAGSRGAASVTREDLDYLLSGPSGG